MSTIVTLTRLAVEAGDMELGIGLLLLPLLNPVEVAEHVASLGVVTGGRLIVGVGVGYRDEEYAAFGVPKSEAGKRFSANVKILRSLLSGEPTDADLPWCTLRGATLSVRPPRIPELWIGANADVAVRRAARLADAWLINPHAPLSTITRQRKLFDDERARVGLPQPRQTPLFREVFCAPRSEDAHELAQRYLGAKYQRYTAWGQADVLPDDDTFEGPFGELAAQRFVIGNPEECLEILNSWRSAIGVNHFILRAHWAGMPFEKAKTSVRLLAQEVFPHLRELEDEERVW
jgi:alkanesulfonate monooxygenase SsuD/methylene tetrahydromethanopterin reductase-like flavin-dependent oxidoreductase (luciferase family)